MIKTGIPTAPLPKHNQQAYNLRQLFRRCLGEEAIVVRSSENSRRSNGERMRERWAAPSCRAVNPRQLSALCRQLSKGLQLTDKLRAYVLVWARYLFRGFCRPQRIFGTRWCALHLVHMKPLSSGPSSPFGS